MDAELQFLLSDDFQRLEEKRERLCGAGIPPESRASLDHMLRIELTHGSTAIEGNTLTLRETQLLIDEGIAPAGAKELREIHEAVNHDAALRRIQRWVEEQRPVTELAICEIHRMVLTNIDDHRGGTYRDVRVMVTGAPRQPLRPEAISDEMRALESRIASGSAHPVGLAIESHYHFVKIHPFFDGNGRTARLLMNWIFLRAGYPLTVIPGDERTEYITSIDEADRDRPLGFYRYLCGCVERSLDRYLDLVSNSAV